MDIKRKDLKTLAKEGRVNIDPGLVDELLDEAVQKLLDEYAERCESNKRQRCLPR